MVLQRQNDSRVALLQFIQETQQRKVDDLQAVLTHLKVSASAQIAPCMQTGVGCWRGPI